MLAPKPQPITTYQILTEPEGVAAFSGGTISHTPPSNFSSSFCEAFTIKLNMMIGERVYHSKDAYQVLAQVFGASFSESAVRIKARAQLEQLTDILRNNLKIEFATIALVEKVLEDALWIASGDFLKSFCDAFVTELNKMGGDCAYCALDGYEVLRRVFGVNFSEVHVRAVSRTKLERLINALRKVLKIEVANIAQVANALEVALRQASSLFDTECPSGDGKQVMTRQTVIPLFQQFQSGVG